MGELKRLVLDFRTGELVIRTLYRSEADTNPGTVSRRRQVENRVREGLQDALEELQGDDVEIVGTGGFTTREDILSPGPMK